MDQCRNELSYETMVAYDNVVGHYYDLFEVCAPWDSNLGKEVEKQGGKVLRLGPHNGFDLTTKEGFRKAAQAFRTYRPRHGHFSPACFPWTQFQNLNQKTDEQRQSLHEKRELSRRVLKNIVKLAEIQVQELEGTISGEQPWTAKTWNEPTWSKLTRMAGGRFRVDGCRFGMKSPQNGFLLQKGWGFFSTHRGIQFAIQKTCNHPPEKHTPIQGKVTALTAEYPVQLCKHFVTALMDRKSEFAGLCHDLGMFQRMEKGKHSPKDCAEIHANDGVENNTVDIDPESDNPGPQQEPQEVGDQAVLVPNQNEGQPEEEGPEVLTQDERNKLRLIHRNLGHPHSSVLVRMLKQAGAEEKFISAAQKLECEVCKKNAPRKPVLPATPHVPKQKWDTISVDTFWWKHPRKGKDGEERHLVGISFLDEATDLHVACVVREDKKMCASVTGPEFKKKLLKMWLSQFPKPKRLRCDTEGCFRDKGVIQWLEDNMIQPLPIAGEAYWQIGKHSRHLGTLKNQMTKLAEEFADDVSAKEIVALSVSAKNELHAIKGYSPNQWAFGQNPKRVWSFLNCYEHLPSMSSEEPTFHENIRRMAMAREVFIRCDSERRLKRVALLKSRKQQVFQSGDLVYYYRKGKGYGAKVRGRWHGPARVLFVEKTTEHARGNVGSIIWVSHGVTLLRCAPEQLQHVMRDLSEVDEAINGPFSPEEFLRGKHVYVDVTAEQPELENHAVDEADDAWRHDANEMRLDIDDNGDKPEGPEKRLRLNEKTSFKFRDLDWVAGQPPSESHVEPGQPHQRSHESQGGSGDGGVQQDESGGAGSGETHQRGTQRQDLRLGMDQPDLLRDLVRRTSPGEEGLEAIPDVHSEEDREVGERSRDHQEGEEQEFRARVPPQHSEGGLLYGPMRRNSGVSLGRGRWLEGDQRRQAPREVEPGDSRASSSSGRPHADDAAPRSTSPRTGEQDLRELSRLSQKRDDQTAELGPQSISKRLKTEFQKRKQGVEIILTVGSRDVYWDKRDKRNGCWVVNAKAKRSAEVNVKTLTRKEMEEFQQAKHKEIDSYMEHVAVDICKKQGIDPQRVLGMRWILTWKNLTNENGEVTGKKPKARLIIKGFQDPDLLRIPRDSPTLSTLGRNMLFGISAQNKWRLAIGDIKTAFLNGDPTELERNIYGEPPEDAKEYLGMSKDELFRIRKAIYGLLNAPRKWMEKLSKELRVNGWVQSKLEPCLWRLYENGVLCGILGVHVDDVVCSGNGDLFDEKIQHLRSIFPFGSWKCAQDESVVFCGCEVKQNRDGSIDVQQERFALGLNEVNLSRERKEQEEQPATEEEKKQMKGLLGGLAWRANQTAPWLSATTSILQGYTQKARVKDVLLANKLCRLQRANATVGLHFSCDIHEPVVLTFSDASHANRADGTSQGGMITVLTDKKVLHGQKGPFSVLSWHSKKLKRIARSSTCAEVQACANAYDELEYIKQLYCEIQCERGINTKTADALIATVEGAVIVDAKNLYDATTRVTSAGLQLEEKRLCLEVLHIKERAETTNSVMKWVDSDQQFANDLTKIFSVDQLLNLLRTGYIGITFDPTFTSAKRKRQRCRVEQTDLFSEMILYMLEATKEEDL